MAESIAQPNALNLTGNVAENWRYFKQEFELYLVAAGLDTKPGKQKVALLLHVAKKPAIDVYNTFTFAGAEDPPPPRMLVSSINSMHTVTPKQTKLMNDTSSTCLTNSRGKLLNNSSPI